MYQYVYTYKELDAAELLFGSLYPQFLSCPFWLGVGTVVKREILCRGPSDEQHEPCERNPKGSLPVLSCSF